MSCDDDTFGPAAAAVASTLIETAKLNDIGI